MISELTSVFHASPCLIPTNEEMFVKNIEELKDEELCDFLQEIDNEEKRLQNIQECNQCQNEEEKKEVEVRKHLAGRECIIRVSNIGSAILFGLFGVAFQPTKLGLQLSIAMGTPLGFFFSNGIITKYLTNFEKRTKLADSRIARLTEKTNQISTKLLSEEESKDRVQLQTAHDGLNSTITKYKILSGQQPNQVGTVYFDETGKLCGHVTMTVITPVNFYSIRTRNISNQPVTQYVTEYKHEKRTVIL